MAATFVYTDSYYIDDAVNADSSIPGWGVIRYSYRPLFGDYGAGLLEMLDTANRQGRKAFFVAARKFLADRVKKIELPGAEGFNPADVKAWENVDLNLINVLSLRIQSSSQAVFDDLSKN